MITSRLIVNGRVLTVKTRDWNELEEYIKQLNAEMQQREDSLPASSDGRKGSKKIEQPIPAESTGSEESGE